MSIKTALSFVSHENRIEDSETYDKNPELFIPDAMITNSWGTKIVLNDL